MVKKFQIKKARCDQRAFYNKLYNECYKMADLTAKLIELRHDQIYNVLVFMKANLWIFFKTAIIFDIF
jgi:hypothetical protein